MFSLSDYNPDYFVDRPAALKGIREWADAAQVEKRVLSVVAPPGCGKTWVLKRLHSEWQNPGKRFVVWIDIPVLVNRSEEQDRNRMINPDVFHRCFEKVQLHAQRHCPHIPPISTNMDFPAMVSRLAALLCDCKLDKVPLVIVDGYDEISEKQAEVISLRILERIIEQPCIRLLIAHRGDQKVRGDSIRRNQKRLFLQELDPLSENFAFHQFKMLFQNKYPDIPLLDPNPWMKQFKLYKWNHPLINHFLFEHGLAADSSQLRQLTNQELFECSRTVIERPDSAGTPRYYPLTIDEFQLLHQIVIQLKEEWDKAELEAMLNLNFHLDERIGKLFGLGLIVNISDSSFYHVVDGLRDLLCEIDISQIKFI